MSNNILVDRLADYVYYPFNWDGVIVTIEEIKKGVLNESVLEVNEVYEDCPAVRATQDAKSKEWHIGRVKYFVNHPEKITPLYVDNYCDGGVIFDDPILVDGHHRFAAHIVIGNPTCEIEYGGLISTLEYLEGKRDSIESD